jgi:DNA-binding MarR family transcriptional regulator
MINPLSEGFMREHRLAVKLHRLGEILRSELDAALSAHAVNFLQLNTLIAVASGAAHSPAAISRFLMVDPAVVTRTLTKLEAREFIQRTQSQQDRRSVCISLTSAGQTVLIQLCEITSNVLESRLCRVPNDAFDLLSGILSAFIED